MIPMLVARLPLPIRTTRDLQVARRVINLIRRDPECLFSWKPEQNHRFDVRQRFELALSLLITLALKAGDGNPEIRARAVQQLYFKGPRAPGEAVRAGELLLRSRMITGQTDVETFWLAAAFTFSLDGYAEKELQQIAWMYLCHAPFALDSVSARKFAAYSRKLKRATYPDWPLELARALISRTEHADVGATLLEAILCSHFDARTMVDVTRRLKFAPISPPAPIRDTIDLLAHHYVKIQADQAPAREIISAAIWLSDDAGPLMLYLQEQVFDMDYPEVYELVRVHFPDRDFLERVYDTYIASGRFGTARRLVECQLIRRLLPWRIGTLRAQVNKTLFKVIADLESIDQPERILSIRVALLNAKTRRFSPLALQLARRLLSLQTSQIGGLIPDSDRETLRTYIRESDPYWLLEREQVYLQEQAGDMSLNEQKLVRGMQSWLHENVRDRVDQPADGRLSVVEETWTHSETLTGMQAFFERWLWTLYQKVYTPKNVKRLVSELEQVTGTAFSDLTSADIVGPTLLAKTYMAEARKLAVGVGTLSAVVPGTPGVLLDLAALSLVSIRAVNRIGCCFGILPGSKDGFRFLLQVMAFSSSYESQGDIAAYILNQRPRVLRGVAMASVHYLPSLLNYLEKKSITSVQRNDGDIADVLEPGGQARKRSGWVKRLPWLGIVTAVGADVLMVNALSDTAYHLGLRQLLLVRHGYWNPNSNRD